MEYNPIEPHHCIMCFALIGPLDVLGGDGGEGGDDLPSVDHGRRTDEGRDKNILDSTQLCFKFTHMP